MSPKRPNQPNLCLASALVQIFDVYFIQEGVERWSAGESLRERIKLRVLPGMLNRVGQESLSAQLNYTENTPSKKTAKT